MKQKKLYESFIYLIILCIYCPIFYIYPAILYQQPIEIYANKTSAHSSLPSHDAARHHLVLHLFPPSPPLNTDPPPLLPTTAHPHVIPKRRYINRFLASPAFSETAYLYVPIKFSFIDHQPALRTGQSLLGASIGQLLLEVLECELLAFEAEGVVVEMGESMINRIALHAFELVSGVNGVGLSWLGDGRCRDRDDFVPV